MKKLILALVAMTIALISCEKEDKYAFEGYQWMTEEYEQCDPADYGKSGCAMLPAGKLILDVGVTKPGKAYLLWQVMGSNSHYSGGELVTLIEDEYQYDAENATFAITRFGGEVSFLSENIVKFVEGGTDVIMFERASKTVKVKSAIDPFPAEFAISSDKDEDWAGGTIKFTANAAVAEWSAELMFPEGANLNEYGDSHDNKKAEINQKGELLLKLHWKVIPGGYDNLDMDIKVTATSASGQTATKIVKSKYWQPEIYAFDGNNGIGEKLYASNIVGGEEICVALFDAEDKLIPDWFEEGSGWKDESNCLRTFGKMGTYICTAVLKREQMTDQSATARIRIIYGEEQQDIDFYGIR